MIRTHKVGTITFGASLIAFGCAFLLHFFIPTFSLRLVISFWPVIFIILGIEILISSLSREDNSLLVYDKTAIIMTALLVIFAMGMGIFSTVLEYMTAHLY